MTDSAATLPQINAPCPPVPDGCGALAGELCTSHGGTRLRRTSVHLARTAAWRDDVDRPACVFCDIVAGRAPAMVVCRWPDALAITPRHPVTRGHVLVLPVRHVPDFVADPVVYGVTAQRAAELAGDLGLTAANSITSKGREATQTVLHLHLHLVPRGAGDGLPLPWTPQQTGAAA